MAGPLNFGLQIGKADKFMRLVVGKADNSHLSKELITATNNLEVKSRKTYTRHHALDNVMIISTLRAMSGITRFT